MPTASELQAQADALLRAAHEAAAREAEAARPVADINASLAEIESAIARERTSPFAVDHVLLAIHEALRAIVAQIAADTGSAASTQAVEATPEHA